LVSVVRWKAAASVVGWAGPLSGVERSKPAPSTAATGPVVPSLGAVRFPSRNSTSRVEDRVDTTAQLLQETGHMTPRHQRTLGRRRLLFALGGAAVAAPAVAALPGRLGGRSAASV
jgi:hypothetical protein